MQPSFGLLVVIHNRIALQIKQIKLAIQLVKVEKFINSKAHQSLVL